MAETAVLSSPPRVSRYRSQRIAQAQIESSSPPPLPQSPPLENDNVVRAKSRYRRKPGPDGRPMTARDPNPSSSTHSLPPHESRPLTASQAPPTRREQKPRVERPRRVDSAGTPEVQQVKAERERKDVRLEQRPQAPVQVPKERRDVRPVTRSQAPPPDRKPTKSSSPPVEASPSPPVITIKPAPAVKPAPKPIQVDGPPTSAQIRATKSTSELPRYSDVDNEPEGCFGLFKRKRVNQQIPDNPLARPVMTKDGPPVIKPGGGGIVPGTDAPVSAVNAGDRRVLVECGKSKTMFPVTPTTTPVDLIKSAANCMSERIDVHSAVLLEHFGTVGVQRPLRRYEHIRDVMNSWDTDQQNSLLLVDSGTGTSETELSIAGVPLAKPNDASWLMLYSQKPGKWDRRLITLKSEGQLICQKDPNKPQTENICHLSDFDIYLPTQEKMKKKIRPPKKHCFAVKSQQKTSMFESTQNFVHFFSTGDKHTADAFYGAIQSWRSWYLVNVMGEGNRSPPADADHGFRRSNDFARGHRQQESFSSHYQLGSFQPLLDMGDFERRQSSERRRSMNAQTTAVAANQESVKRAHPPITRKGREHLAYDEPLANLARRPSLSDKRRSSLDSSKGGTEAFASNGLLGRTYSQRQRDLTDREKDKEVPWTTGPNLLNSVNTSYDDTIVDDYTKRMSYENGLRRRNSSRHRSGDLQRRGSKTGGELGRSNSRVKPLIDLTPQYREPPQHAKRGRGHKPDLVGPGGLVDNATSPDDPLGIPPSTDWRGTRNRGQSLSKHRPNTSRTAEAFTGEGLLASNGHQGWGVGDRGRGVMDGSHARGPMLSVDEPSKFAQGSLMHRVEQETGREGPIIDREKRDERYETTGEMF